MAEWTYSLCSSLCTWYINQANTYPQNWLQLIFSLENGEDKAIISSWFHQSLGKPCLNGLGPQYWGYLEAMVVHNFHLRTGGAERGHLRECVWGQLGLHDEFQARHNACHSISLSLSFLLSKMEVRGVHVLEWQDCIHMCCQLCWCTPARHAGVGGRKLKSPCVFEFRYLRTCPWQVYRNGAAHCCSRRSYQPSHLNTVEK